MERIKNIAMLDYIYGMTDYMAAFSSLISQEHPEYKEEWLQVYFNQKSLLEAELTREHPIFAVMQLQPDRHIDIANLSRRELSMKGIQVIASNYDLVYITLPEAGTVHEILKAQYRNLKQQFPETFYGQHIINIGDICIVGNRADDLEAYFIDETAFYKISHFITPELSRMIAAGLDVKKELELLQQSPVQNSNVLTRRTYIEEAYRNVFAFKRQKFPGGTFDNKKKKQSPSRSENKRRFTDDEIHIINHTDMIDLLSSMGYHMVRVGNVYTTKEHDSLRIFNRVSYVRYSTGKGGTAVSFLQNEHNMTFVEAATYLLEFNGVHREISLYQKSPGGTRQPMHQAAAAAVEVKEKKPFVLPEKNENYRRLYAYLIQSRGLDKSTVDHFVQAGLIYEEKEHHNIVFVSKDKDGNARHAFCRGSSTGKAFKCDVPGSDKTYGFCHLDAASRELVVVEGAIDLMSFYESLRGDHINILALGTNSSGALDRFLEDHPEIYIVCLRLDCDEAGTKGTEKIVEKLKEKKIACVDIRIWEEGCKDENDILRKNKQREKEANVVMQPR